MRSKTIRQYECGCSEGPLFKKDMLEYCGKHGDGIQVDYSAARYKAWEEQNDDSTMRNAKQGSNISGKRITTTEAKKGSRLGGSTSSGTSPNGPSSLTKMELSALSGNGGFGRIGKTPDAGSIYVKRRGR